MKYLIKTLRHKHWIENGLPIWWRTNSSGYTDNPDNAGRYTKEEAKKLCSDTHGDDIAVPENKIARYQNKYNKLKILKIRTILENTTIKQAQEILNKVLKSRINLK